MAGDAREVSWDWEDAGGAGVEFFWQLFFGEGFRHFGKWNVWKLGMKKNGRGMGISRYV